MPRSRSRRRAALAPDERGLPAVVRSRSTTWTAALRLMEERRRHADRFAGAATATHRSDRRLNGVGWLARTGRRSAGRAHRTFSDFRCLFQERWLCRRPAGSVSAEARFRVQSRATPAAGTSLRGSIRPSAAEVWPYEIAVRATGSGQSGLDGGKKLQDYFVDRKVDRKQRDNRAAGGRWRR